MGPRPDGEVRIHRRAELLVLAAAAVWFALLCNRGLTTVDEGVQVNYAWQLAQGRMIYRDFHAHTTPLTFLTLAALFRLFGFHLIVGRIWLVAQGLAGVMMMLRLGRRRLSYPFSLLPAVLCIPYSVTMTSFPTYNFDSMFYLVLGLVCFDKGLDRPQAVWFFAGGLGGSLAAATKHPMALPALALTAASLWVLIRRGDERGKVIRCALAAAAGIMVPALALGAWLLATGAVPGFRDCMTQFIGYRRAVVLNYVLPGTAVIVLGTAAMWAAQRLGRRFPRAEAPLWATIVIAALALPAVTPWPVSAPLVAGILLLSLIVLAAPAPEDRDPWLPVQVLGLGRLLAETVSNVDLAHMLNSGPGAMLPMGLLLDKLWRGRPGGGNWLRRTAAAGFVALMLYGFWMDMKLEDLYYRTGPRWRATAPLPVRGAEGIRTWPGQAQELAAVVNWVQANTASEDRIFVYPWDVMLYPLCNRLPATYTTFIFYDSVNAKVIARVLDDLERFRPPAIIVRMNGSAVDHHVGPKLSAMIDAYLAEHYRNGPRFGDFQIMVRTSSE